MGHNDWDDNQQPAKHTDHDWRSVAGDFDFIPLIDVSGIRSDKLEDREKVGAEIRDACIRVGFFYIENHGIPQDLIDNVFQVAESFFSLPFEQKMEVFIENSPNFRGYTPVGGSGKPDLDGKGNLNEAFEWGHAKDLNDDPSETCTDPFMQGPNQWPREPASVMGTLSAYYRELRTFGRLLTRVIALSLGLPEGHFDPDITHPGCSAVLAHYPPQPRHAISRGLDAHTDSEFFTILAPGPVRALEVVNKAGQWISAPPKPGTFIVNVGDQLQTVTNDLYISTRHRVMNYTGKERYAVPFFFMFNYETFVKPIPQLMANGHVAKNSVITAGEMYRDNMRALHKIASTMSEFDKYRI